jgi:hypothetical protein
MIFFGESSLRRAIEEFIQHYHQERNHQGLENKIIHPEFPAFPVEGKVRGHKRFGEPLRDNFRAAAGNQCIRVYGHYGIDQDGTAYQSNLAATKQLRLGTERNTGLTLVQTRLRTLDQHNKGNRSNF